MRWGWEGRSEGSQTCFLPCARPQCHRHCPVMVTAPAAAQTKSGAQERDRLRGIGFCPNPITFITNHTV